MINNKILMKSYKYCHQSRRIIMVNKMDELKKLNSLKGQKRE